jgi:hypothetical protein
MSGYGGLPSVFNAAKVDECRVNASAMRNRAMAAKDPDVRQTMMQIADEWDRLAAEIEAALP